MSNQASLRRLNLGCGFDYRPGYLNVDFHNSLVADCHMSAANLDLPSGHFEEVLLRDVIEHLGYCDTFYMLADLWLSMIPAGTLLIVTPALDRSIAHYMEASGSPADREDILCWIYGTEDRGMGHRFCFPEDLLCAILERAGFSDLTVQHREPARFRPDLIVQAKKSPGSRFEARNRIISAIHRSAKIQITYSDFPYFEKMLESFIDVADGEELSKLCEESMYLAPKLGLILIDLSKDRCKELLGKEGFERTVARLRRAASINPFSLIADCPQGYAGAIDAVRDFIYGTKSAPEPATCAFSADFFTRENYELYQMYRKALDVKGANGSHAHRT